MHIQSSLGAGIFALAICLLFAFTASAQVYPIGNPDADTSPDNSFLNDDNTSLQTDGTDTSDDTSTPGVPNTGTDSSDMNTINSTVDTTSSTSSNTTTPGVPNTGIGGDSAATWLMLILSGMLAVGGIGYMVTAPRLQK